MRDLPPHSGVLYMLTGTKHANVLVVSIHSLRKTGYLGPIHIAVGCDDSEGLARLIVADKRLDSEGGRMTWQRWSPPSGQRGMAYAAKTWMDSLSHFERTLFIDADTLVVGDIWPIFQFGEYGVTLTQFSSWLSSGRKIANRIRPWMDLAPDDVRKMAAEPLPAVNTGVIAFDRSDGAAAFFAEWKSLTMKRPCFICDELSAQIIYHRHAVRVLDSRWNCSPIHDARKDAVIYHFHGRKHVNREQGRAIWLPAYDECCRLNIADINAWTPAGDKRLREYLEGRDGAGTLNGDDEDTEPAPKEEDALR